MIRSKNKFLSMVLALAMVLTLFVPLGGLAQAATSDPYMTTADGIYSETVTIGGFDYVTFKAVPAYDTGLGYWAGSPFDTPADALAVDWNISAPGYYVDAEYYEAYGSGYAACINIMVGYYFDEDYNLVIGDPEVGPVVVTATNPATNATIDFNIVANQNPAIYTLAEDVIFQVVDPSTSLINDGSGDVYANDYSSKFDVRSFPTVMDSVVRMMYSSSGSVIEAYDVSPYGDYVKSMKVNNVNYIEYYDDVNEVFIGWQYRVYRDSDGDGTYDLVPLSASIGADSFVLLEGDLVQWRYGDMDLVTFPATVTP